jgi:hypothetical protein
MATVHPASDVEFDLMPIDLDAQKAPGEDQADVATALGKRSKIRLGAPRCTDWLAELAGQGALPADVERKAREGYAFRRVRPSLTLLPDRGCVFLSAELSIELAAEPDGTGDHDNGRGAGRPLAYDVLPHEVLYQVSEKDTTRTAYETGGGVGVGPAKLLAKVTRETMIERDGVRYLRERYGYGINFGEVGWRMQAGGALPVAGDVTDLEFMAQVPAHCTLTGRFRIVAEIAIQTSIDRWLTRVFGPARDGDLLDVVYPLDAS